MDSSTPNLDPATRQQLQVIELQNSVAALKQTYETLQPILADVHERLAALEKARTIQIGLNAQFNEKLLPRTGEVSTPKLKNFLKFPW